MRRIACVLFCALLLGLAGGAGPSRSSTNPAGPDQLEAVIVTLRQQAELRSIRGSRRSRLNQVINSLQATANTSQRQLRALLAVRRAQGKVADVVPFWIFNGFAVRATPDVVDELRARPEVLRVAPNETIESQPGAAVSAPAEPGVALVNAPALWELGFRGQGVVVASMDSGVDVGHPELAARWRGGSNSWYDPNGEHPSAPYDSSGHGTWTTGVMVAGASGGTAVGMAPGATWIAVKIFDDHGKATFSRIHQGYQWLLDPDGNPATDDAAHIVNNSWSLAAPGCNLEFQNDLRSLRAVGILPVFAAGNTGPRAATSVSPSNNPEAFAVGATTAADTIYTYGARGPSACGEAATIYPDVVAPGVNVRTTDLFGLYASVSGTSIAAPATTGIAALLLSAYPDLGADALAAALKTGVDLGPAGPDNTFGYARVDAFAAYGSITPPPPPAPDFTIAVSPSSVGTTPGGDANATVTVSALGGFAADVVLSAAGLPSGGAATFAPNQIPGGAGTSQLVLTTTVSTPPGSYTVTVTGTSGSLSHTASVILEVRAPADFTLGISPSSAAVVAGASAAYTVSVGALNGFSSDVVLSLGGLPAGAAGSFAPQTIAGAGTSALTVIVSDSTAPGTYAFVVTGTSGSLVRSSVAAVVVTQPPSAETAFPASTTIEIGTLRSGSAADLGADDARVFTVNAAISGFARVSSWYGTVTGVPNGVSALKVTYKGRNSVACSQSVSVWNWTTGSWAQLDSRSVGTSDVLVANLTPPGVLANYVSGTTGPGDVRIRIRCSSTFTTFYASGNLMKLDYVT